MIGVTDIVYISFHETYYCLYPASGGQVLRVSATGLNRLGNKIASLDTDNNHRYTNDKEHLETEVTKMSKMQQIWTEALPVKSGQVIPSGTEYIEAEDITGTKVSGLSINVESNNIAVGAYEEIYIRTLEPLPDLDDTGLADFTVFKDGSVSIDRRGAVGSRSLVPLDNQQARNFARKLMEALNA